MSDEPKTVSELEQKLVELQTERDQVQRDLIYARNAIKVREEVLKPEGSEDSLESDE